MWKMLWKKEAKEKINMRVSWKTSIVKWTNKLVPHPSFPFCTVRGLAWMFIRVSCSCSGLWLLEFMIVPIVFEEDQAICVGPQLGFALFSFFLQLLASIHLTRFPSSIWWKVKVWLSIIKCAVFIQGHLLQHSTVFVNCIIVTTRLAGLASIPHTLPHT